MRKINSARQDQWFADSDERRRAGVCHAEPAPIICAPCTPQPAAKPASCHRRKASGGFTLIETLVAMSIVGVLSSVAYPSFETQLQKARRTDVLVSMMQVQMAEERWRANNGSYGTLAEVGVAAISGSGHYALQVTQPGPDGFVIAAAAAGTQARDTACRHMTLSVVGANVIQASGPDAAAGNEVAANRRCWNL